jgi:putative membrane protein insertion efficiency factor
MPGGAEEHGARPSPPRSIAPLVFAAFFGFAAGDALRPPPDQALARAAIGLIAAYRGAVSPVLSRAGLARCLYRPTCSAYGREVIRRYGFPRGAWMATGRVLRCNPLARGGDDPVP